MGPPGRGKQGPPWASRRLPARCSEAAESMPVSWGGSHRHGTLSRPGSEPGREGPVGAGCGPGCVLGHTSTTAHRPSCTAEGGQRLQTVHAKVGQWGHTTGTRLQLVGSSLHSLPEPTPATVRGCSHSPDLCCAHRSLSPGTSSAAGLWRQLGGAAAGSGGCALRVSPSAPRGFSDPRLPCSRTATWTKSWVHSQVTVWVLVQVFLLGTQTGTRLF